MCHLVPLDIENRWSDLLAVLIERDPHAASVAFGWPDEPVTVTREAQGEGKDRIDLVVHGSGTQVGVIEAKVLSGLGPRQLERYQRAMPHAQRFAVIFPKRLPVTVVGDWLPATWESVLDTFSHSAVPWVAETAKAWCEYLEAAMPPVGADTVWNEFSAGQDFVLAMRARSSWVYGELHPPESVELKILPSSSGVSWVVKMSTPAAAPGYSIVVEFEEKWPNRSWPILAPSPAPDVKGPSVRVCLAMTDVDTSADFDWEYLHALWPVMAAARTDWVTTSARPRAAHDRAGYDRIVAAGAPRYLGIGFGHAQTSKSRECMFGARLQLAADITLGELASVMRKLVPLLLTLAAISPTVSTLRS